MKKGNLLAALFGVVAMVGLCFGAYTVFTDLRTTGDMIVGDDLTVTDDASVTGDLTVTGTSTLTGAVSATGALASDVSVTSPFVVFSSTFGISATTPTIIGQLALDTTFDVYVASGTDNPTQWIKVGTQ